MITIFGSNASRTTRCLWPLEELGLDYARNEVRGPGTKTPEYLAVNPGGKVPALVDGDVVMSESLAINLYLAQRYGQGTLWPVDPAGQAAALQWTLWAASEAEGHVIAIAIELMMRSAEERNHETIARAKEQLVSRMDRLETALAERPYLAGDSFTIADLNVCCAIMHLPRFDFDFAPWPKLARWLETCLARPAQQKVAALPRG